MLWFKKFMSVHGAFFVGVYFISFFLLVTLGSRIKFDTFYGDVAFKVGASRIYLPFTSSLAAAIFFVIIYSVYRFLKNP